MIRLTDLIEILATNKLSVDTTWVAADPYDSSGNAFVLCRMLSVEERQQLVHGERLDPRVTIGSIGLVEFDPHRYTPHMKAVEVRHFYSRQRCACCGKHAWALAHDPPTPTCRFMEGPV